MRIILGTTVRWMGRIEMALAMLLTVLIAATIGMQIIARGVFNAPVAWMEESVMIMFIHLTLLAAAVATKEKRHILVDLFPEGRVARALGVVMSGLTVATLILILANIAPVVKVEMRRTTVSLPWNFPIAYYNSIPLFYGFCSIILAITNDLLFSHDKQQGALV